ncbi:MAG: lysophospholipid acyltransferase family protein [Pseudomonadota bacterium]
MTARLRMALVIVCVAVLTILLMPVQLIAIKLDLKLARKMPKLWHRIVIWLIGLRINVSGKLVKDRPLLIVSNHVSWADILVLGSIAELSFIAKHEVDQLPGANLLARMQRTIFVVREAKRDVGKQAREITQRLLSGDAMVLFAEGTTADGHRILDFKSSLFGAAQYAVKEGGVDHVYVQPVSITYTRLHGMPLGRHGRTLSAWAGDEELGPHLKQFVRKSAWDVEVGIGSATRIDETVHRRDIASQTRKQVRAMHLAAVRRGSAATETE